MASIVWGRDPQEAIEEPYEYEAQIQFAREAEKVLKLFSSELEKYTSKFNLNDTSVEKAIWMLQNDALDSLKDMLNSLIHKKHKIAGKLLRDITETLDLAAYFYSSNEHSKKALNKWFNDEIIVHSEFRDFIEMEAGLPAKEASRLYYRSLSKFAHRTYKTLLYGYSIGRDNQICYDGYDEDSFMALPQTISMYYAILADTIMKFTSELMQRELVPSSRIIEIFEESTEKETVPRRFKPMREFIEEQIALLKKSS
jgi:hypothetical protein